MKKMQTMAALGVGCGLAGLALADPPTQPVTLAATNNATVQPGGPRAGNNGKTGFNVEGSANGAFASFGVLEFAFPEPDMPFEMEDFGDLTLSLTHRNAGFTLPGPVVVYYTPDTTAVIEPATEGMVMYQGQADGSIGADTVDPAFLPLSLLGTFNFEGTSDSPNGVVDLIALTPDAATEGALLNLFKAGGTLRLIVAPNDATTAATWAGFSYDPPDPSPEEPLPQGAWAPRLHFTAIGAETTLVVGDADGDGDVDGNDIAIWAQNFTGSGATGGTRSRGDFDSDGDIDGDDAAAWAQHFTGSLAGGGGAMVAAVPEPAGAMAAFALGAVLCARRGRRGR